MHTADWVNLAGIMVNVCIFAVGALILPGVRGTQKAVEQNSLELHKVQLELATLKTQMTGLDTLRTDLSALRTNMHGMKDLLHAMQLRLAMHGLLNDSHKDD